MSESYVMSVQNVTKIYKQGDESIKALDNANLNITDGEFTVITGTSGSGKSTLLSLCAGFIKPTSGRIVYKDECVNEMSYNKLSEYHREKVSVISQTFDLLPMMTLYENIILPCVLSSRPVPKRQLDELCEICGLSDRLNHFPSELSGGQKQRTAIARALINSQKMIFADEPTGNLDSASSDAITDLLLKVNSSGVNIMMITHDMNVARKISANAEITKTYSIENGIVRKV